MIPIGEPSSDAVAAMAAMKKLRAASKPIVSCQAGINPLSRPARERPSSARASAKPVKISPVLWNCH